MVIYLVSSLKALYIHFALSCMLRILWKISATESKIVKNPTLVLKHCIWFKMKSSISAILLQVDSNSNLFLFIIVLYLVSFKNLFFYRHI